MKINNNPNDVSCLNGWRGLTLLLILITGLVFLIVSCAWLGITISEEKSTPLSLPDKKFFPIGIYHVPEENIEQIKEYGFNLSVGGQCGELSYLKKLHDQGMKAIPLTDFEHLENYMKPRLNHPAVFAWYLLDEPDLNKIPQEKIQNLYTQLKSTKTPYPAFLTVWSSKRYKDFIAFTDIFGADPYPIRSKTDDTKNNLRQVQMAMLKAKEADPNKPIIAALQAFSWEPEFPRMPTSQEERCMAYLALVYGSQGIIYFQYWDLFIAEKGEKGKELRAAIRNINKELQQLGSILLEPKPVLGKDIQVTQLDGRPLDGNFNIPGSDGKPIISVSEKEWFIPLTLREQKGKYYLFAVNPDRVEHEVVIELPEALSGKSVRTLFEQHEVTIEAGRLKDKFAPMQVWVYVFQ